MNSKQPLTSEEAVVYYFCRAWATWEEALEFHGDWLEQSFKFNNADTYLYQAIGLAGLRWPWQYTLPRKRI